MFQSTPSRRGRPFMLPLVLQLPCSFNPLPHAEGDPCGQCRSKRVQVFQSTPSRRGRRSTHFSEALSSSFNPLPHAEGDRNDNQLVNTDNRFQSTPSRRGRLAGVLEKYPLVEVSIHSLTQRETYGVCQRISAVTFQSTPSRRGRR